MQPKEVLPLFLLFGKCPLIGASRLIFMESAPQNTSYGNHKKTQQKPEDAIKGANLTHQISLLLRVVPYIQLQEFVHHTAENQFHPCEQGASRQCLLQKGPASHSQVGCVKEKESRTSRQAHAPMGKPSPKQLYQAVSRGTYRINCNPFFQTFQSHHPA